MDQQGVRFIYYSTIRGATQSELNAENILYFGIFIRIPRRNVELIGEIELGIDHSQLFKDVELNGFRYAYVPDGILERVEIRERDTGDVLAFWRVPFRRKEEIQDGLIAGSVLKAEQYPTTD